MLDFVPIYSNLFSKSRAVFRDILSCNSWFACLIWLVTHLSLIVLCCRLDTSLFSSNMIITKTEITCLDEITEHCLNNCWSIFMHNFQCYNLLRTKWLLYQSHWWCRYFSEHLCYNDCQCKNSSSNKIELKHLLGSPYETAETYFSWSCWTNWRSLRVELILLQKQTLVPGWLLSTYRCRGSFSSRDGLWLCEANTRLDWEKMQLILSSRKCLISQNWEVMSKIM